MVRSANQSKRMISVSKGSTPCVTHHLPAVRSTHPTATLSASQPLRPPKGCRGPARRTSANAAPQFCRVGGARKFNGAFREPVEENDKRFQGFDPVRNPPFACGSLHAPYSYSFSLSAASAAQGLPGASRDEPPPMQLPQFCRVGGARKFNGAFREPVEENDKRFQGFDPVRNPPFACGSLHAPYRYSFSLSPLRPPKGCRGPARRIFANAAPQFCRVGGARKFNGAFREPVEENDKRFQGFDPVRNPPFACGSLHAPYSYSFSLSLASAAQGLPVASATNLRQCIPQFCRVGGARKFDGAFREPVEENDKRFRGFDPVRNPPLACGSLHAPYSYSFSLSAASAAQGLPGASATNRRQCNSAVL